MPKVFVGALGGTIAMSSDSSNDPVHPKLGAEDLVSAVPELLEIADIKSKTIKNVASPSIVVDDILAAYRYAIEAVEAGADGVVLTHGTDTLEESAFLLDLIWDREEPLVLTGAMRSPNLLSPDGAGNLMSAVVTAADKRSKSLGVLVVLDEAVHLAKTVAKTNSSSVWTFQSPSWGPVARIVEREIHYCMKPSDRNSSLPLPALGPINIPIIESPFADEGSWVESIASTKPRAIIVSASGAAHLSMAAAEKLEKVIENGIPVIVASRTGSGKTLTRTYGYPGSESWLLEHGFILSGFLTARKARILAHVLISAGYSGGKLKEKIEAYGA
ncbi:asparaginase [Propionimicrobium lymphophilum]|uniref:asparaginase n=1 Tax=Propionimicrobium lymphophilum TaxID=33012 RepID=UPI003EC4CE9A